MAETLPVTVVTDSTADLPAELAREHGIVVVPLSLDIGGQTYQDGVDLTPEAFLDKLRTSPTLPKTSQPPMTAFEQVFKEALDRDHDVVCVTISSELSGTFNSARLAAESVGNERVHVVDSLSATMQIGWIAVEAARAAQRGLAASDVARIANDAIERSHLFAVLQTLDYVYKGGRIGRAQQLAGSALAIKPVLGVVEGVVTPIERVRTWKRALARAIELTRSAGTLTDIAVLHSDNLPDAERTAEALRQVAPDARISISWAGPVITTYAGPGAVGIAALVAAKDSK